VTSGGLHTHSPLTQEVPAPQQKSPHSVSPAGQPHSPPLQVAPLSQQLSPQIVSCPDGQHTPSGCASPLAQSGASAGQPPPAQGVTVPGGALPDMPLTVQPASVQSAQSTPLGAQYVVVQGVALGSTQGDGDGAEDLLLTHTPEMQLSREVAPVLQQPVTHSGPKHGLNVDSFEHCWLALQVPPGGQQVPAPHGTGDGEAQAPESGARMHSSLDVLPQVAPVGQQ
jgi:hypothetical protein